jgi:hypothetical protein
MNLYNAAKTLTKLFNSLGNSYITENFEEQPFLFNVYLKRGDPMFEEADYLAEVHTNRFVPKFFKLRSNPKKKVSSEKIREKFQEMTSYLDEVANEGKKIQVRFMDMDYR